MNDTVVLKFGGTSVGSPERIRAVADIVARHRAECSRVLVVVSAMGQSTDELIALALAVSPQAQHPRNRREMDMLLSTGERVSMALLSLALSERGLAAVSFTGSQSGIITDTIHGEARIAEIRPLRLREGLDQGRVVIVAGFQGVSQSKEITTLGRGGSDTSAVALAAALRASRAVIFTDVNGFYSADPRRVPAARQHARVGWDTALLAAHFGAQVLHPRCVELAGKHGLRIELKSSFSDAPGTIIEGVDGMSLEGPKVFSVAAQRGLQRSSVAGLSRAEGEKLFESLRRHGGKVVGWRFDESCLSVLLDVAGGAPDLNALAAPATASSPRPLARVTIVGMGLLNSTETHAAFRGVFADAGVEIIDADAYPTFISALVPDDDRVDGLVRRAHAVFCES